MTRPGHHAVGFAAAALALLCAAALLPLDAPPLSHFSCPVKAATGLPCITCGCTHAFHFFVRGDLRAAFLSSPLGLVLAAACAAHLALTLARGAGAPVAPRWPSMTPRTLRWVVGSAVALNWAFLAARSLG